MRYMIMVRATAMTQRGEFPPDTDKLMAAMGAYHEELARAGVLLDGAGLKPSRDGWRVRWDGQGGQRVIDGPYAESKELIAGYTLIQVRSREEALEWARRFPNPMGEGREAEIEVRPLYEAEDFEGVGDAGSDRTLATQRRVAASREQVFAAISDPQRLARWWGPAGFRNHFNTFEFRTGGRWSHVMEGPDGKRYENEAGFDVIDPPGRVVIRHISAPHFFLAITLTADGDGTRVGWKQVFDSAAVREQLQAVCIPANEQNLDRLEAELARGA